MKYIYLLSLIIASLLFACDDDENISVELDNGKYYIGDNPKGEVQKYIYNFYKKYNSIILTNPDTTDYRYNFTSMNKVVMKPAVSKNLYKEELSSEENKYLMDGFKFLEEELLSQYDDDFKKEYLPTTIQLADVIKTWNQGWDTIQPKVLASYNFIAIAGINDEISDLTEEQKAEYKRQFNYQLWYNYLLHGVGKLNIPKNFYAVSKEYYGTEYEDSDRMGDYEISHTYGFLVGTQWGEFTVDYKDLISYLEFIFLKDRSELNDLMENYPKIKLKYNILRDAILDDFNVDISTLNN